MNSDGDGFKWRNLEWRTRIYEYANAKYCHYEKTREYIYNFRHSCAIQVRPDQPASRDILLRVARDRISGKKKSKTICEILHNTYTNINVEKSNKRRVGEVGREGE